MRCCTRIRFSLQTPNRINIDATMRVTVLQLWTDCRINCGGHYNSTHTMIDSCNTVLPLLTYCGVIVSWLSSILCGVLWKSTVDFWTPASRGGKLCSPIERCEGQRCGLTVRTRWRKSTVDFWTPASRGGKKDEKKMKKSSKRCCAL